MSVGGKVVQTHYMGDGKLYVNTWDGDDYCAIFVEDKSSKKIQLGDALWWQGEFAYLTKKNEKGETIGVEKPMKKLSGSGVSHPLGEEFQIKGVK